MVQAPTQAIGQHSTLLSLFSAMRANGQPGAGKRTIAQGRVLFSRSLSAQTALTDELAWQLQGTALIAPAHGAKFDWPAQIAWLHAASFAYCQHITLQHIAYRLTGAMGRTAAGPQEHELPTFSCEGRALIGTT